MPVISIIRSNGLFFTIYTCFFAFLLFTEFILSVILHFNLLKINKEIKKENMQNRFTSDLINDYKNLLKRQQDLVNTERYIDNYFLENSKKKVLLFRFLKKSETIYLLTGLLGGFLVILFSILAIDFEGIEGFENLYFYLKDIIFSLKPALFYFFIGIVFSIISKILFSLLNFQERINIIKISLVNYLENNIKYKYSRELKEIELFEKLIKTVNTGFVRIEDSISNQFTELNEKISKFLDCREKESKVIKDTTITDKKAE